MEIEEIKKYEIVCNEIIQKFCDKQDIEFDGWVGDEIGGIASFISEYFFNLSDIILDLKTNQPTGFILNWQTDGVEYHFHVENGNYINYKSYIMGLRYEK